MERYWEYLSKNPALLKQRLRSFLLKHNALDQFEHNLKHHDPIQHGAKNVDEIVDFSVNRYPPLIAALKVIDRAFIWRETPEDDHFWRNLHKKWLNQKANVLYL